MAAKRINLQDHLAKLADRGIDIDTEDGQVFHIPPPELWPDSITTGSPQKDDAVALLGQEQFDAFVAAGGSPRVLYSIINDGFGADVPES